MLASLLMILLGGGDWISSGSSSITACIWSFEILLRWLFRFYVLKLLKLFKRRIGYSDIFLWGCYDSLLTRFYCLLLSLVLRVKGGGSSGSSIAESRPNGLTVIIPGLGRFSWNVYVNRLAESGLANDFLIPLYPALFPRYKSIFWFFYSLLLEDSLIFSLASLTLVEGLRLSSVLNESSLLSLTRRGVALTLDLTWI